MQTEDIAARVCNSVEVPTMIVAHIRGGGLFLKTSVTVKDYDRLMYPVWAMVEGKELNLLTDLIHEDESVFFGKARVRVYEIVS